MDVAGDYIDKMRNSKGPVLIEAVTYRHYGHVDFRKDIDVGVNRSQEDVADWLKRDPIIRLQNSMLKAGILSQEYLNLIEEDIRTNIDQAWKEAITDPYPNISDLLTRVYHNE